MSSSPQRTALRCAITVRTDDLDLVLEGPATRVGDNAKLRRVADVLSPTGT